MQKIQNIKILNKLLMTSKISATFCPEVSVYNKTRETQEKNNISPPVIVSYTENSHGFSDLRKTYNL